MVEDFTAKNVPELLRYALAQATVHSDTSTLRFLLERCTPPNWMPATDSDGRPGVVLPYTIFDAAGLDPNDLAFVVSEEGRITITASDYPDAPAPGIGPGAAPMPQAAE
jgi:hypothetical protein